MFNIVANKVPESNNECKNLNKGATDSKPNLYLLNFD